MIDRYNALTLFLRRACCLSTKSDALLFYYMYYDYYALPTITAGLVLGRVFFVIITLVLFGI